MNTSDITNYIQKMEQLIQMQQIELDKTRNLLARAIEVPGQVKIVLGEYKVPDSISFERNALGYLKAITLPTPMKSMYERITELKKELNL